MKDMYEQLIEHIINDNEKAARELFHRIVVAKSRDIYESLMDEELGGNKAQNFVHDVSDEVEHDEAGLGEEDEMGDEFGDDEMDGDDDMADMDSDGMGGEEDLESKVFDLESELEDLKAQFAELQGGEEAEEHDHPGIHDVGGDDVEGDMGSDLDGDDDMGDEEDMGGEEGMMEAGKPFGKSGSGMSGSGKSGSGKSGSGMMEAENPFAKSGSGKSGSGKSGSGKSGSGKMEARSQAEIMKEYVNKVKDFYKSGDESEGKTVGTGGDSPTINKRSVSLEKGPDFGGESTNIARGGAEQSPDSKPIARPKNEYSKGEKEQPLASKDGGYRNKIGGNEKYWSKKEPTYKDGGDHQSTETGKTVGAGDGNGGGDKPHVYDKGTLGGKSQPTGKKK